MTFCIIRVQSAVAGLRTPELAAANTNRRLCVVSAGKSLAAAGIICWEVWDGRARRTSVSDFEIPRGVRLGVDHAPRIGVSDGGVARAIVAAVAGPPQQFVIIIRRCCGFVSSVGACG